MSRNEQTSFEFQAGLQAPAYVNDIASDSDWCKPFAFGIVCLLSATASGGLILGVGPFSEQLVQEGFFSDECGTDKACKYDAVSPVFDGGFQIMTWGSCAVGLALDRVGPRAMAVFGLSVSAAGHLMLSHASSDTSAQMLMLAYGLIGAGGNGLYISCFTFADLFDRKCKGVMVAAISATFNLAGMVFLVLNVPGITVQRFFHGSFLYTVCCAVIVFFLFPDDAFPSCDYADCADVTRVRLHMLLRRRLRKLLQMCLRTERHAGTQTEVRPATSALTTQQRSTWTIATLRGAVASRRYAAFSLTFSWCAVVNVFVGGLVPVLAHTKSDNQAAVDGFVNYAYPLLGNSTFFFSPFVGRLIDKHGFWPAMLGLLLVTASLIGSCFLPGLGSQYLMLLLFNLVQAFAYSLEFAYISMTFAPALYGPLIAVTIGLQGALGFVAWPGLSPNPFGADEYGTPLLAIMLPPVLALLCYAPWQQFKFEQQTDWESAGQTMTSLTEQDHEQLRFSSGTEAPLAAAADDTSGAARKESDSSGPQTLISNVRNGNISVRQASSRVLT